MKHSILTPDQIARVSDWTKESSPDGNCVEVGSVDGLVALRDSDTPDHAVGVTRKDFGFFLKGAKNGKFDGFAELTV